MILLVVVFGALVSFTEASIASFAPLAVVLVSAAVAETVAEAYDLPGAIFRVALGLALVAVSANWSLSPGESVVGPLLVALVGAWTAFDGVQAIRRSDDEPSATEEYLDADDRDETMLRFQISGTVARALHDEPRTVDELAADLDLNRSRVERALVALEDRNVVSREGETYYADEKRFGKLSPVKQFVRWLPRRLARPFRRQR